jgi:hypothetical protein
MKTAVTVTEPEQQKNFFLEAAGNRMGKLLKFNKGKWLIGDDIVPAGTEYIAHIDQLVCGWVKFEDGTVVERDLGKIANGHKPKKRKELSDTDPATWEKDEKTGLPKDPWSEQWAVPLINVERGDVVTFASGTDGGINAIKDLCLTYGHQQRPNLRPIIALRGSSYKHPKWGRIETPELIVVGWDDGGVTKREPATTAAKQITAPAAKNITATAAENYDNEITYDLGNDDDK